MTQSVFNKHYLYWNDLIKAAQADNTALAPVRKISHNKIEEDELMPLGTYFKVLLSIQE